MQWFLSLLLSYAQQLAQSITSVLSSKCIFLINMALLFHPIKCLQLSSNAVAILVWNDLAIFSDLHLQLDNVCSYHDVHLLSRPWN